MPTTLPVLDLRALPGLELRQGKGTWVTIQAAPGQIIVETGNMLQNLTDGLFKSMTHRVVNPAGNRDRRLAMALFVHPRREVDLTPLPQCVARRFENNAWRECFSDQCLHPTLR